MTEFLLYFSLLFSADSVSEPKTALEAPSEIHFSEAFVPRKLPQKKPKTELPPFLAESYEQGASLLMLDLKTNKSLFEISPNTPRPIASISKLMTALIILEEHGLDEIVTIAPTATKAAGTKVGFFAHEKVLLSDVLQTMLIGSGNDAAVALAIHNAGSEQDFVKKMNEYAKKYELDSATFVNASGLDLWDSAQKKFYGNTMSVKDVAKLARMLFSRKFVADTVQNKKLEITSEDGFSHEVSTTNALLGTYPGTKGLKTGRTDLAKTCFVGITEKETGEELLTVVLGVEDRFGDTKKLLDWGFENFEWN